jgi:hypothetical protein
LLFSNSACTATPRGEDGDDYLREWALWGVRNLCQGSDAARAEIEGLQPQTAADSQQLAAMVGLALSNLFWPSASSSQNEVKKSFFHFSPSWLVLLSHTDTHTLFTTLLLLCGQNAAQLMTPICSM